MSDHPMFSPEYTALSGGKERKIKRRFMSIAIVTAGGLGTGGSELGRLSFPDVRRALDSLVMGRSKTKKVAMPSVSATRAKAFLAFFPFPG
jgi:hypothetical protein